jgi:hypothetical protein
MNRHIGSQNKWDLASLAEQNKANPNADQISKKLNG